MDNQLRIIGLFEKLIASGMDINDNSCGATLLHFACKRGRLDVVKILLDLSALASIRDCWELLPIFYACQCGNTKMVEILWLIEPALSLECAEANFEPDDTQRHNMEVPNSLPFVNAIA